MFSLLSIQIHHVPVGASDATCRNLLPIPLRLCPLKHLHSKVTEYYPILVRMSICMCLLVVSPQHTKELWWGMHFKMLCLRPCPKRKESHIMGTHSCWISNPWLPCVSHHASKFQKANSSVIERGVPKERMGFRFTLITGKSAEKHFLYKILLCKNKIVLEFNTSYHCAPKLTIEVLRHLFLTDRLCELLHAHRICLNAG